MCFKIGSMYCYAVFIALCLFIVVPLLINLLLRLLYCYDQLISIPDKHPYLSGWCCPHSEVGPGTDARYGRRHYTSQQTPRSRGSSSRRAARPSAAAALAVARGCPASLCGVAPTRVLRGRRTAGGLGAGGDGRPAPCPGRAV